jgi:hypothetical protein
MRFNILSENSHPGRFRLAGIAALAILVILFLFGGGASAAPSTDVSGDIDEDTTWTLAGSPYIVTENVRVLSGVKLTIQPGVVVKFNTDRKLRIAGILDARGTASNPITFTSNAAVPAPGDWGNIVLTNTNLAAAKTADQAEVIDNFLWYCVVEYAGGTTPGAVRVDGTSSWIDNCDVRNNANGGIRVVYTGGTTVIVTDNHVHHNYFDGDGGGIYALNSEISGNIVHDNIATGFGGGVYATSSQVYGNQVYENSGHTGGGLYADRSDLTSNNVLFNRSTGPGAGIYFLGSTNLLNNTIVGNSAFGAGVFGGLGIDGVPPFTANNIYANTPYDLVLETASNFKAEGNFWGTSNGSEILAKVYDFLDDDDRGIVDFEPFNSAPPTNAPTPPPLNVNASFVADVATLTWSVIPGTRTYEYHVYYDTDGSGWPYDGTGLAEGPSPVDVGNANAAVLNGLAQSPYYLAVSASDLSSGESWFSKEVSNLNQIYLPAVPIVVDIP